jgi:hypothetical protein
VKRSSSAALLRQRVRVESAEAFVECRVQPSTKAAPFSIDNFKRTLYFLTLKTRFAGRGFFAASGNCDRSLQMEAKLLTVLVFVAVYALVATEVLNKAVAALLGVMVILMAGVTDVHTAAGYIDVETIMLLLGMMVIVDFDLIDHVITEEGEISVKKESIGR